MPLQGEEGHASLKGGENSSRPSPQQARPKGKGWGLIWNWQLGRTELRFPIFEKESKNKYGAMRSPSQICNVTHWDCHKCKASQRLLYKNLSMHLV